MSRFFMVDRAAETTGACRKSSIRAIRGALPGGGGPESAFPAPFPVTPRRGRRVLAGVVSRLVTRILDDAATHAANPLSHRYFSTLLIGRFLAPSLRSL